MIELKHRNPAPFALNNFVAQNPGVGVAAFGEKLFHAIKLHVKACLSEDQGGICVYCERELASNDGQVEHIKPKGGPNAHPHLCFVYTNYAHSCINSKTCGQKKGDGILPIEPFEGCNSSWTISTDGTIEPVLGLSRVDRHKVCQTRDMLGLNQDSDLVDERKRWFARALEILQQSPDHFDDFLVGAPYRHILKSVFNG